MTLLTLHDDDGTELARNADPKSLWKFWFAVQRPGRIAEVRVDGLTLYTFPTDPPFLVSTGAIVDINMEPIALPLPVES